MVMNTQQLFYLTEIERTRSISQAAENLYMSQPNLSRVLKETEQSLGFAIFQRTRRGVQPTQKGSAFLQHAKVILREAEFMESLGPSHGPENRFRICLPRSRYYLEQVRCYLDKLAPGAPLDGLLRECHARQALECLSNSDVALAVIRYGVEYQAYFSEQAQARQLRLVPLSQVEYRLLMAKDHPLARRETPSRRELEKYTELLHRDTLWPGRKGGRGIYVVDRQAQFQLLRTMAGAYCWSEPMEADFLAGEGLAQRPCREGGAIYQNALVYRPQGAMSTLEEGFLSYITGGACPITEASSITESEEGD